jgi:hypothetical protein
VRAPRLGAAPRDSLWAYPGTQALPADPIDAGAHVSFSEQDRRDAREQARVYPMDSQV